MSKIRDIDLTTKRLESLAKLVVDKWDMESLVEFAQEQVFQDYQYDIQRAVYDAEDYDNIYSLSEALELEQDLQNALYILKRDHILKEDSTYSQEMQELLEPIDE